MTELPRGTVTFLFSDVEGSTRLAAALGDAWPEILEQHRALLRSAFTAHDGHEVKTEGDGFFVAFGRARDAVLAAVAAERALGAHAWSAGAQIRVRIGIHTGDGTVIDDDYVGLAVHVAARVSAAAHGGQIVVSDTTRQLAGEVGNGVGFVPLGPQRLKDIEDRVLLHQVTHADLQHDFPPLRVLGGIPTNLPAQLTSFVGREEELRVVGELLGAHRLVTLSGAGGAGKTRLAIEAAAALDQFDDGIWLVELARVTDPDVVWSAVAGALGLRTAGEGHDAASIVTSYFASRHALLILDNCEHVIAAAAVVADTLLRAAPALRILSTSREALGIAGEHAWRVPSLPVPDVEPGAQSEDCWGSTAVRLFVERAEAAGAPIGRTPADLAAVARICQRLDGMPLAIELAAARARSLTSGQLAERLDDRFRLLTGGSRTALPRQQTLQALVDWSHDLLDDRERAVLRRASVFVGGFTLEAAEAVCSGQEADAGDVLDVLDSLVAKSLVVPPTEPPSRFRLLETIRSYARQKLLDAGEVDTVRDAHLGWTVRLAEEAAAGLGGAAEPEWLDRVDGEHDNIRAALEWATDAAGRGEAALGILRHAWRFWWIRGKWAEGRDWCERALRAAPEAPPVARGDALWLVGLFAGFLGDPAREEAAHAEAMQIYEDSKDIRGQAAALWGLAYANFRSGRRKLAAELLERAVDLAESANDDLVLGWCLLLLGDVRTWQGRSTAEVNERAFEVGMRSHDRWTQAMAKQSFASGATKRGDFAAARGHLGDAIELWRSLGDVFGAAQTLTTLASIELANDNFDEADRSACDAVALCRDAGLDRLAGGVGGMRVLIALRRGDPGARALLEAFLSGPGATRVFLNNVVWRATRAGLARDVLPAIDALESLCDVDEGGAFSAAHTLGEALWSLGDLARARAWFERYGEGGGFDYPALAALGLARCELEDGDAPAAATLLQSGLQTAIDSEVGDSALCAAAEVLAALAQPVGAARMLGAARRRFSAATPPYDRQRATAVEEDVRRTLGDDVVERELAALAGASAAEIAAAFTAALE